VLRGEIAAQPSEPDWQRGTFSENSHRSRVLRLGTTGPACHGQTPARSEERSPVGDFGLRWRATTNRSFVLLTSLYRIRLYLVRLDGVPPE